MTIYQLSGTNLNGLKWVWILAWVPSLRLKEYGGVCSASLRNNAALCVRATAPSSPPDTYSYKLVPRSSCGRKPSASVTLQRDDAVNTLPNRFNRESKAAAQLLRRSVLF